MPAWMSDAELGRLRDDLRDLQERSGSIEEAIGLVAEAIRRVADREPAVSKDLMVSIMPEASVFKQEQFFLTGGGGVLDDAATFFYLPAAGAAPRCRQVVQ